MDSALRVCKVTCSMHTFLQKNKIFFTFFSDFENFLGA